MYTTGQFSGMFRVSKKLLRHYNEIGLLIPAETDSSNGYFYYSQADHDKMKQIMYLRALQLPLSEIKRLVEIPKEQWGDGIHHHLGSIRRQKRGLVRIEKELISLKKQLSEGGSSFSMSKKTEYNIRVFNLKNDMWVVGRGVRVKHGSPEHMPSIQALIENFFGDDVHSLIPNLSTPTLRFGICAEFALETGEFTYMMGDKVTEPITAADTLPDTLRSYMIPSGEYACVTFSASDIETLTKQALGPSYDELFGWLSRSDEWESSEMGVAYEVYDDDRFEVASWPEMDIWTPVRKKSKDKE